MSGFVDEINVASEGGTAITGVSEVEAVAGEGLRGDRYAEGKGYRSGIDECHVTLIEGEAIDAVEVGTDLRIIHGEHRRNIVTSGIRLDDFLGKRFAAGEAVLEYDRPRPPCRYVEMLTERGMAAAPAGGRGGICARVVRSGAIRAKDAIEIL